MGMIDKGRWGKVRMKAMLHQLCQFVLNVKSYKYSHASTFGIWSWQFVKTASALCFSKMDAFFIVTTTMSIMAFANYLIAHSSSFLWSFGLLLLHDNLEDVSSLDNYIFSYFNSFKIDSLSFSTSITSKDLGLFKGIIFRLSFLVFAHRLRLEKHNLWRVTNDE
jgi:hypothetical protein